MLYAVRTADDVAYADEFTRWTEDHGGHAIVTVSGQGEDAWRGRRGRIDPGMLLETIGTTCPLCFVCGPAPMVEDVTRALSHLGIPADHVRTEQWTPAA